MALRSASADRGIATAAPHRGVERMVIDADFERSRWAGIADRSRDHGLSCIPHHGTMPFLRNKSRDRGGCPDARAIVHIAPPRPEATQPIGRRARIPAVREPLLRGRTTTGGARMRTSTVVSPAAIAVPAVGSAFPNFTRLRAWFPQAVWQALRFVSIGLAISMAWLLWTRPADGLVFFWGLVVPALPIVFFVAPGLWRNLCPLAATNQLPRRFGFSRGLTSRTLSEGLAYPLGITAFFVLVMARRFVFNDSGEATALLVAGALALALVGGLLFRGKSGWCSSICPMLSVQRLYGQTPFVTVANTHCAPCVSCAKNCYDFNPASAYLADQYDASRRYRSYRRFFAAVFPGFVLAYFLVPGPQEIGAFLSIGRTLVFMAASLAVFTVVDALLARLRNVTPVLFAAMAINAYYWFATPAAIAAARSLGLPVDALGEIATPVATLPATTIAAWTASALVLVASLAWLRRSFRAERVYLVEQMRLARAGVVKPTPAVVETVREHRAAILRRRQTRRAGARRPAPTPHAVPPSVPATEAPVPALPEASSAPRPVVRIAPTGTSVPSRAGQTLLEAIETGGGDISPGCRMGVCGADPVVVTHGGEHLSAIGDDERCTLDRLGCADGTRMACVARLSGRGEVHVSLDGASVVDWSVETADSTSAAVPAAPATTIRSVVIIGNGIAGLTAADHVRRRDPACAIHVIGRENHLMYNRMGIAKLISGRSGMSGLTLFPEAWYEEHRVTNWVNTHVKAVRTDTRTVLLATGESIEYDRLILATGSSAWVPPIDGFGAPGTFVLREADQAMAVRDYAQQHRARDAVIVGAGLLGLEAAHALLQLGLRVTVLSNTPQVMDRQLDTAGAAVLRRYLESRGIQVRTDVQTRAVVTDDAGHASAVRLHDGTELPAEILLVCAGIRANTMLARRAGLAVNQGIVVDDRLATSARGIFAAGDAAEHDGALPGLWNVAREQGEIAAANAMGEARRYQPAIPSTLLKVSGIDLLSAGKVAATRESESEFVDAGTEGFHYRKLVVVSGRLIGAIMIGRPHEAKVVADLVQRNADVRHALAGLARGDWSALFAAQNAVAEARDAVPA